MKNLTKLGKNTLLCTLLLSGTAYGQDTFQTFGQELNRATLDSAIRYELLKPMVINLQKANVQYQKENTEQGLQMRFMSFGHELEKTSFANELKAEKRKTRTARAVAIGLALLAIIAGAK